jgi:hypothetical protein
MREKAKGDRLEVNRKEARQSEDRQADDDAIFDILDQQVALRFKADQL